MRFNKSLKRGRQGFARRVTYANVVSTLALFLVLAGGSAYAASRLITGKQIAAGTITAKNIKAKSLLAKDFASKQLPAGARGATGATGAIGATGATGAAGAAGAAGSAVAYGAVIVNGADNPVLQPGAFGFTSSPSKPAASTGLYCLPAPSSADALLPASITALGGQAIVFNETSPSSCPDPSMDIAVQGYDPEDGAPTDIAEGGDGFSISLP